MTASDLCRILGNPVAYYIVRLLWGKAMRPMELAERLGVSRTSVVNQLRHLKTAGLVEYRSTGVRRKGRKVEYWLRDRRIGRSLRTLERYVRRLR